MKFACVMAAIVFLAGAARAAQPYDGPAAEAELINAQGESVGIAEITPAPNGVKIILDVQNLPPGTHAFHIHGTGKCDPPDFKTAGGHFNPEAKEHGLKNPKGAHAGDMENFEVGADGMARIEVVNTHVTLGKGKNSVFQPGGTAIVIHEKADDMMSDPAGNAGGRIACGVIEATDSDD
jgi:superoxide dismutase, Cu-Zn family